MRRPGFTTQSSDINESRRDRVRMAMAVLRGIAASFARFAGIKACKSVDYPRVTPAAFFPRRGGMEKVHLLSGPCVDLAFRHGDDGIWKSTASRCDRKFSENSPLQSIHQNFQLLGTNDKIVPNDRNGQSAATFFRVLFRFLFILIYNKSWLLPQIKMLELYHCWWTSWCSACRIYFSESIFSFAKPLLFSRFGTRRYLR